MGGAAKGFAKLMPHQKPIRGRIRVEPDIVRRQDLGTRKSEKSRQEDHRGADRSISRNEHEAFSAVNSG
jgi:hypothetical protein